MAHEALGNIGAGDFEPIDPEDQFPFGQQRAAVDGSDQVAGVGPANAELTLYLSGCHDEVLYQTCQLTVSTDGAGNYTLGLKEQIVFAEIDFDRVEKTKGMNITFVTTAETDEEAKELLAHLGMPFRS